MTAVYMGPLPKPESEPDVNRSIVKSANTTNDSHSIDQSNRTRTFEPLN